ncbi:ribonuclease P protein component [Rubrivirga litoralis]|uniref:Ribonuclease P protein component n=1 Tax=Rubrivirga litoralis TaxID=3075598 RepID=A0ABU3BM86_9BACT|nr:ribonuclease P protein component [Rubrivirga sp. F394]MDT0630336.1 ribonuclease P protein component [Rubrivirga sp. F394]
MRRHTFPRTRRLKRRRLIRPLFERGRADVGRVREGVVALLYRAVPREALGHDVGLQVGFAPGRRARTNAGRTRLRRLMREAFRQHQGPLLDRFDGRPDALTVMVLFRGREATASADLRRDLPRALARLARRELPPAADAPADPPRP